MILFYSLCLPILIVSPATPVDDPRASPLHCQTVPDVVSLRPRSLTLTACHWCEHHIRG